MLNVVLNFSGTDAARRRVLHAGALLFCSATAQSRSLCDLARDMVEEAFAGFDAEHAQEHMPVERFVAIVGPLKSRFTNAKETQERLREYLISSGVDRETTYFDVPRLRVVPHSDYLSSGVSYAYKAHRDTWYSSPAAQINWWLPIWDVTLERSMAFYPHYWDQPIANTSAEFDYGEWVSGGRLAAASQIGRDMRKHPLPLAEPAAQDRVCFAASRGETILFSATHLHATVPNISGATRFSTDFRTVDIEDLRAGRGGPNLDTRASGTTLGDFRRVDDLAPLGASLGRAAA